MERELLFEEDGYQMYKEYAMDEEFFKIMEHASLGTKQTLYHHYYSREHLSHIPGPYFFTVRRDGRLQAAVTFCRRTIKSRGQENQGLYIRYFAAAPEMKGKGLVGRFSKLVMQWAIEHEDVKPDIVCFAKGVGSGMPIGGILAPESIMDWKPGSHGSTFGGNPIAAVSALTTLQVIEEENLLARADETGRFIMDALVEMEDRHPSLGDVRGRGLMIGMEFVKDRKTKERMVDLRDHVIQYAFEHGLLLIPCGTNSIRITPSLNVPHNLVEEGLHIFEAALTDAEAKYL